MWIPEENFTYPRLIKQMMKRDQPIEETQFQFVMCNLLSLRIDNEKFFEGEES